MNFNKRLIFHQNNSFNVLKYYENVPFYQQLIIVINNSFEFNRPY